MHTFKGKKVFCSSVETTPYLMEMGVFFHLNECLEFEKKQHYMLDSSFVVNI